MRSSYTETVMPQSADEAIEAFGDGAGVTVLAGGTILLPEVTYGRYPRGGRTVMLHRAGLSGISGDEPVRIGAMTTLSEVAMSGIEPLASAAGAVADGEIRGQATLGGNLCSPPGVDSPRGDLQAPLLAMDARVHCAGPGGPLTEAVEQFLGAADPRLVLSIELRRPSRGAYVSQRRAHAHAYSVLAIAVAEVDGTLRVAAAGVGPHALRLRGVEAALRDGAGLEEAAARSTDDVEPEDDALASAWYRNQILPVLTRRALQLMEEGTDQWN